jgi:hypothetical protein
MQAANHCPYCGGPYSLTQSCTGPRTVDLNENTCPEMAAHRRVVKEALNEEERYGRKNSQAGDDA